MMLRHARHLLKLGVYGSRDSRALIGLWMTGSVRYSSGGASSSISSISISSSSSRAATATTTLRTTTIPENTNINDKLIPMLPSNDISSIYNVISSYKSKQPIHLDGKIHKWFWHNVPVHKSYAHYQFLIEHNVVLSDSAYCKKMFRKLLMGSEVDFQLATFQVFLVDQDHVPIFKEKFHSLHDFDMMLHIFNSVVRRKDFQHVKYFLSSLTDKMAMLTPRQMDAHALRDVELMYVKFNNSLLYYLLMSGNTEVFIKTFKNVQNYIKNSSLSKQTGNSEVNRTIMKSIHLYLMLLKENNMPDLTLDLLRTLQSVKGPGNKVFRRFLASTITSTLRSFNDPKLTANFVLSTHQTIKTAKTLNDLGLWNYIFHNRPGVLDESQLKQELEAIKIKKASDSLRPVGVMSKCILTELYRSFLSISANTMSSTEYDKCIRSLYEQYVRYCENNKSLLSATKHDTGILSTILYHTRYSLQNNQLAYSFVTHFYSQDFIKHVSNNVKKCPFSIVIYNNNFLATDKLEKLFTLMDKNGYPLTFHICYSMVKRCLSTRNDEEAHYWYQRIIDGGFRFDNRGLMDLVLRKNWQFPPNFDKNQLLKLQSEEDGLELNQIVEDNTSNSSGLIETYNDIVSNIKTNMHI